MINICEVVMKVVEKITSLLRVVIVAKGGGETAGFRVP